MLGKLPPVQKVVDLRAGCAAHHDRATRSSTLWHGGERMIRVIGPSPQRPAVLVDISLREQPMWTRHGRLLLAHPERSRS